MGGRTGCLDGFVAIAGFPGTAGLFEAEPLYGFGLIIVSMGGGLRGEASLAAPRGRATGGRATGGLAGDAGSGTW